MRHRIFFGKTGLEVNRLGLGGIPIQRVDENVAVKTVRHAVKCGVDLIDTARAYTTSDEIIGKALEQASKQVVIAAKYAKGTIVYQPDRTYRMLHVLSGLGLAQK
jgi:aryl-alcohol dehydrogenase-like predicted oxidoreductase